MGAVAVVAVGGGLWRADDQGLFDPGSGPAYQAREAWKPEPRSPHDLIAAAVLAANAHNTQPWIFRIGGSRIDLLADPRRKIGAVDPLQREHFISLGCAVENLPLAAGAAGLRPRLTLMPDRGRPTHATTVDMSPGTADPSPLYRSIPERHTNRWDYETGRRVPQSVLDELADLVADDYIRPLCSPVADTAPSGTAWSM